MDALYPPVPATDVAADLAQCPVWDAAKRQLVWVDALGGALLTGAVRIERIGTSVLARVEGHVSFVAPGEDGGYVLGAGRDLVRLNADGVRIQQRRLLTDNLASRFNDGAVDPDGRILAGTCPLDGQNGPQQLLRLEHSGRITVVDADLGLSNGLGWSPDGRLFYSVDSWAGCVYVRSYDPLGDSIGGRRTLIRMPGHTPDGMCVDADGRLWIAMWGDGEVRGYAPDGTLLCTVPVPVPLVSGCAFIGSMYDRFVITTARGGSRGDDMSKAPNGAGRLFLTDVPATGRAPTLWRPQYLG